MVTPTASILFLLLISLLIHATTPTALSTSVSGIGRANAEISCLIELAPAENIRIRVGDFLWVYMNCSCCQESVEKLADLLRNQIDQEGTSLTPGGAEDGLFVVRIATMNKHVMTPSKYDYRRLHTFLPKCMDSKLCVNIQYILPEFPLGFYVEANQVGRTEMQISVNWCNTTRAAVLLKPSHTVESSIVLNTTRLVTTIIRRRRIFYTVFDWSAVFIACLTALSVGCCTEVAHLKRHLRRPSSLLPGLVCQHILMPAVALGINLAIGLPNDLAFGLFTTATLPGGGLAHLIVFLIDGDRPLSTALSTLNAILNLCVAPAWILGFGWYFSLDFSVGPFILWLVPVLLAQLGGVTLRYFKPSAADAVMNWLTRPLLLLSGILLITLGIYVNQYAFNYINYSLVLAVSLAIFGGFFLGGATGYITRQDKPSRRSLAAETSVYNCLIVIPVLRYSLPQPDADLAATVPLWAFFFTPGPILIYFVIHKAKGWMMEFIEKRKEKQYRHYSIVSSLAKMTEEVTAVSAPLVLDDPHSNEIMGNKITKEERTTAL